MNKESNTSLEQLRHRAERALASGEFDKQSNLIDYVENYIHELQVHQIELEMQAEELRLAQEKLLESRDEYAELYHNAPVGYLTLTEEGMVEKVNDTFASMVDTDIGRILRKPLSRFILSEDQPLFFTVCKKAYNSKSLRNCELTFVRLDQTTFHGRVDCVPTSDRKTQTPQLRLSVVDITREKRAEEEKVKLQQELVVAQKVDSLRRFAGGIAHNFNNILTGVLGHLEVVRQRQLPTGNTGELIDSAYGLALKAADLGTMMLYYLGQTTGNRKNVDIVDTVDNLFRIYRNTVHGKIQMIYKPEQGPIYVQANPVQIAQIVNNLTTNAVEAIGQNQGAIQLQLIQTTITDDNAPLAYSGERINPGRYVCIEVSDTGCGMSEETLRAAAAPFFTTKLTGRGLGLSAIVGIVGSHKGYFMLESRKNQGTTASVYLPLAKHILPQQAKQLVDNPASSLAGRKILCVDDDPNVRTVMRYLLAGYGCEVYEAEGGVQAVEIFAAQHDQIDGVLLDFAMPDLDGNLTLVELRKIEPRIPVLLISGYLQDQIDVVFTEEKPDAFLQKPFDNKGLVASLRAILSPQKQVA